MKRKVDGVIIDSREFVEQEQKLKEVTAKTQEIASRPKGLARIRAKSSNHSDLKKRLNMTMLFDNFLAAGMHTFLYGPSGSMKSTITASIVLDPKFAEKYETHYWAFDTDQGFNTAFAKIIEDRQLQNRVQLLEDVTSNDFYDMYKEAIEAKETMKDILVVIDTYKFVANGDVNDKKTNARTMHFIKDITKLGATVLSLGHTNKDKKENSGTAEIEQDSDGLLRIDAIDNGDHKIATIKKVGRVRFAFIKPTTFKAALDKTETTDVVARSYQLITGVQHQEEFMDVESLIAVKELSEQDTEIIELIQDVITSFKEAPKMTMLIDTIFQSDMNMGASKAVIKKKLHAYNGREWYLHKNPHSKHGKVVSLDSNVPELVKSINDQINTRTLSDKGENDVF